MRRIESVGFENFEWDDAKSLQVLAQREIDFLQVASALLEPHLSSESDKQGEARTLAVCMVGSQIVRVVYTIRDSRCRIITAMAARRDERKRYRDIFGG